MAVNMNKRDRLQKILIVLVALFGIFQDAISTTTTPTQAANATTVVTTPVPTNTTTGPTTPVPTTTTTVPTTTTTTIAPLQPPTALDPNTRVYICIYMRVQNSYWSVTSKMVCGLVEIHILMVRRTSIFLQEAHVHYSLLSQFCLAGPSMITAKH